MRPFLVNGKVWGVVRVSPSDPHLIDRTGTRTIATADPATRMIHVSSLLVPPFLDQVLLHEVSHAVTMSHGLLDSLHEQIPEEYWVQAEEWSAQVMEKHGIEAVVLTSQSLGRPLCVRGFCSD